MRHKQESTEPKQSPDFVWLMAWVYAGGAILVAALSFIPFMRERLWPYGVFLAFAATFHFALVIAKKPEK